MNKIGFALVICYLSVIPHAKASSLLSEIRSGEYCQTQIFDNFKLVEKSGHQAMTNPGGALLNYAVSAEIMCPWGIEFDLNGDGDKDWAGYVRKDGHYYLLAYLSGIRKYTLEQIDTSSKPPTNQFIGWAQVKTINKLSGKNFSQSKTKYALHVTTLGGMTDIYLWNGKKLEKVVTLPQAF